MTDKLIAEMLGLAGHFYETEQLQAADIISRAADELHQCRDRMRWVPVGERLPNDDDGEDVLCLRERGNITVALMNDEGRWYDSMSRQLFDVTHWMPLSEPPQQEQQEQSDGD